MSALSRSSKSLLEELVRLVSGPQSEALDLAQSRASLPVSDGGLGLPADNTPMNRASALGYTLPQYHSTYADISAFDAQMSGLGTHTGTIEQAMNRLRDVTKDRREEYGLSLNSVRDYDEGANIMPLLVRPGRVKNMKDAGLWSDSSAVLEQMPNSSKGLDLYDLAVEDKELYEDSADWLASQENADIFEEVRSMLNADTIRYKNEVENQYGNFAGRPEDVQAQLNKVTAQLTDIDNAASRRMPEVPIPDIEGLTDDQAREAVDQWSVTLSNRSPVDYYTRDETVLVPKLARERDRLKGITNDPNSHVILNSSNIRSRFAAFDPFRRAEDDLLAKWATPVATAGALGAGGALSPEDAIAKAMEAERFTPMPAQPMTSRYPVVGDVASSVESISTPGEMFTPESLAKWLRDLEYGRTSGPLTQVGAALDLVDPAVLGLIGGSLAR